jgi:uncharacterized membrane protein YiaA
LTFFRWEAGKCSSTSPSAGAEQALPILNPRFAAISLQKSVRDRSEGIVVTGLYFGLCWVSLCAVIVLLTVGLWNATLAPSEKGFYTMSFVLSLFAVVAVQKNVRDPA